jgi:hypothetical protein
MHPTAVRQDAQHLSGVGGDAHLANRVLHRIAAALSLSSRQKADAVGEDEAVGRKRQFLDQFEWRVGFEAGDDAASGGASSAHHA